jgi:hypothetical protein
MYKKLITACLGMAAFAAFVLPATASASPTLTAPTGTPYTGLIKATQVGHSTLWNTKKDTRQLTCTGGTMEGEVTRSGTPIEGKITSAVFSGTGGVAHNGLPECTGSVNASVTASVTKLVPWCINSIGTDEFTIIGCSGANLKFSMVTTGIGTCVYESTSHVVGHYTTHPADAVLTVTAVPHENGSPTNGFKKIEGSFLCPTSGMLEMSFTLETAAGQPIYIS